MALDICLALVFRAEPGRCSRRSVKPTMRDSVVSRKTEIIDWRTKRAGAFGEAW